MKKEQEVNKKETAHEVPVQEQSPDTFFDNLPAIQADDLVIYGQLYY